jgi:hypothetical protein
MKHLLFPIGIAMILTGCAGGAAETSQRGLLDQFPEEEATASGTILTNDEVLRSTIQRFGPVEAMRVMRLAASSQRVDCHNRAHELGRMSYEEFSDEVFKLNMPECHSGFYHGSVEAFFNKNGTDNLEENLRTICVADLNAFFTHQCLHGIGHGLMAWSDYALLDALEYCHLIPQDGGKSSCRTGVFMENIVGSLNDSPEARARGHVTKYVNSDPHYPCTLVKEAYKSDCYFLQTDRMLALSENRFEGVARNCEEAPPEYQYSGFGSMGRTVGGTFRGDPTGAIAACTHAKDAENRLACILGAAQDTFWDKNGETLALEFCATLSEEDGKADCYRTIIERSQEILTAEERRAFCKHLPEALRSGCLENVL